MIPEKKVMRQSSIIYNVGQKKKLNVLKFAKKQENLRETESEKEGRGGGGANGQETSDR